MSPQSPNPGQNSSATNGGSTSSDGGDGELGSDAEGKGKTHKMHTKGFQRTVSLKQTFY